MSQLTLQDCITSKTRRAGDQIGRVMAVLEKTVDAAQLDYLSAVDGADDGIRRTVARAKLTQAQYCLDLAKSAL